MTILLPARRAFWQSLAILAVATLWLTAVSLTGITNDADASSQATKPGFRLTILHNNDGESALLPNGDEGGVARFATVVQHAKQQALLTPPNTDSPRQGVLFVSSGDNFLPSPAFAASRHDGVFYDAVALDLLGYDAIALGNHDFDFGPDQLAAFIRQGFRHPGQPPYLSANLDFTGEPALQALVDRGVIAKSTIVQAHGERIGVIGATTVNLPFISSPRRVIVHAVKPAVAAEIDALEASGINKIILISHLQGVAEDIALAKQLAGIDVMIAGGGNELLANPGDRLLPSDTPKDIFGAYPISATDADGKAVPVVTTAGQYSYLGRLVVDFDESGHVIGTSGGPLRVVSPAVGADGVEGDRQMQQRVESPVKAFTANLATHIIAKSAVNLDGTRTNVRSQETNEGDLITDAQLWQAKRLAASFGVESADVALQNGGGIRNDSLIPAGNISELETFEMVPFANFVTVVKGVTRATFKALLENAVSRIDATGAAVGSGTGRFAQVAGFRFTYRSTVPAGRRVLSVTLGDGTPIVRGGVVQPGAALNVAIIDFLARGGDEYDFAGASFTTLGVSYQQAVSNYITAPTAVGGLGGVISATDYPEGGGGRIVRVP